MTKIKNLLDEIKNIIQELTTNTNLTGQTKTDLDKRINHILDKSNPRHTNLTADLEIDLKELETIEKALGQEKIEQVKKQKELEDKNQQLATDNQQKDQQIKEKDEQIGQKITKELIAKLTSLEPGQIAESKLQELKTLLEEVKKKETDLSGTNNRIDETKEEIKKINPPKGTDYWGIGACILGGLTLLITVYLVLARVPKREVC